MYLCTDPILVGKASLIKNCHKMAVFNHIKTIVKTSYSILLKIENEEVESGATFFYV